MEPESVFAAAWQPGRCGAGARRLRSAPRCEWCGSTGAARHVTAAGLSGTQRGEEHLAISAPDLSLQPGVQELHRHSRCLSGGLAKAPRRDRPNRLHRNPRLGNHRSINVKAGIRRFSHTWKSHRRDRTGWLPWRDSNRSASISNRSAGVICKLTSHANISETVRTIFRRYLDLGSMGAVIEDLDQRGIRTNVLTLL